MPRLRKVANWRALAVEMYFYAFGKRCVRCSKPVAAKDFTLYRMAGGRELLLVHARCKP